MSAKPRLLLTGHRGVIGRILRPHLERSYQVIGVDTRSPGEGDSDPIAADTPDLIADVADADAIRPAIAGCDAVLHLATGAAGGWPALVHTEIEGTHVLLGLAAEAGCRRFILASSNHAAGFYEQREAPAIWRAAEPPQLSASAIPVPVGDYGAAKVAAEAIGARFALTTGMGVSCLRIGTVRTVDDLDVAMSTEDFNWLSADRELARARLERTWCTHDRLRAVVDEELSRTVGRFVVRFVTSAGRSAFWSHEPYVIP
jgi:nucleoside-diphosphate-sugar epimerase